MTTDIVFEIEVSWFKLQNVKYGFETNVTDNLSLLASIDYTLEKEISLAHIIFTPIYLQIGPVPVIITPEMDVKVGINGFAYASFSTSIEYSSKFEAGIIYKKDEGWGTYNNFKKSFDFSPPQLSAGVGAKAFIKPEIGMFVYNVLGAYTSATLYSQIKANINETPWWSLYLGMDVGVGAKAKIHSVDLFDFEKDDVITYKYLLAEATGRPNTKPTADFSVIPSYGTTETNFSFDASKCSDNEDPVSALQTRWDWENNGNWDTGYSNNKQIYHRFNNEGTYSVKLEVKDSEGLTDEIIKNVVVTNSTQKLITIISPNGGENWVVGTSHEIQWSDNFDENVRIELWKDNSKITSISNNTESDGSFIWNIPSNFDNSSGYKVKIINSGDESIYDESDDNFTIATSTTGGGSGEGEPCPGIPTITYAGKTYNTVQIGSQCWLKENLDVGILTQSTTDGQQQTDNGVIEKYCYDNDANNCNIYGGLYEWNEAMQYATNEGAQGICPSGWHIPTYTEMQAIETYVKNETAKLVDTNQTTNGYKASNESGFSALFSGHRSSSEGFYSMSGSTNFWSSTEYNSNNSYSMYLNYRISSAGFYESHKNYGFSIRCLKN